MQIAAEIKSESIDIDESELYRTHAGTHARTHTRR